MPKQKPENDPALIEATARQICEGMGDDPDDMVIAGTLPKTRSGCTIINTSHLAPAWTRYVAAAEFVLRYLLVERIVLVKRDTIDPKAKARVLADDPGEFTAGEMLSLKTRIQVSEDFTAYGSRAIDSADDDAVANLRMLRMAQGLPPLDSQVMTEDDVTNPVHDALWYFVDIASNDDTHVDARKIMDAGEILSHVGYLNQPPGRRFWSEDDAWKPDRDALWSVIQFAASINGIGSDFVSKAWAKLFPGQEMSA